MEDIIILIISLSAGFAAGYLVKRYWTVSRKGPSSRSVQAPTYSDTHRYEAEIYVCPPSINPDDLSHSDTSESD
jgi:hypothetical protein